MTKQDFLSGLERALSGEVSQQVLMENMKYYRDYIDGELRRGRSENDVMEELGSPRLIARSIIDAAEAEEEGEAGYGYSRQNIFRQPEGSYEEYEEEPGRRENGGFHVFRTNSSGCLWIAVIVVLILVLAVSMVIRFVYAFPGLVIAGIVLYLIFRRNRRNY